ncbi:hypothetical protein ACLB2K_064451 [Fragaria x ananassa]
MGIEAGFIALVGVEGHTLLGSDRRLITDIATGFEFEDEGKKCRYRGRIVCERVNVEFSSAWEANNRAEPL